MILKGSRAPWTGLVLSGGGARGAYEAGVVQYLRKEMPPRIAAHIRFEIICGTSVGAINSCYLAASSHTPEFQGDILVDNWQKMRIDGVYHLGLREILNLPKFLIGSRGRGDLDTAVGPGRLGGLFNTSPLEKMVHSGIDWSLVTNNIASGTLKALAVNATHISSGKTHVFVESHGKQLPPWSTDPQISAFSVEIGPAHALASAAIPWIFPAVEIEGQIYSDGALKLNTPIAPAIRLGADRLLVVGLKSEAEIVSESSSDKIESFPSALFLLGKILNALMVDKTEYELKRLERFNALIDLGIAECGEKFSNAQRDVMSALRGAAYRKIDALTVRPSEDIAKIAMRHLRTGNVVTRAGGLMSPLLRRMGDIAEGQAGDLVSYLLFDGDFASDLIRLGMHDADSMRQRIIEFFSA